MGRSHHQRFTKSVRFLDHLLRFIYYEISNAFSANFLVDQLEEDSGSDKIAVGSNDREDKHKGGSSIGLIFNFNQKETMDPHKSS